MDTATLIAGMVIWVGTVSGLLVAMDIYSRPSTPDEEFESSEWNLTKHVD